jgi:hypothetical protein
MIKQTDGEIPLFQMLIINKKGIRYYHSYDEYSGA